jgi:hypothetical protein
MDELLFRNSPVKVAALALSAVGFVAIPFALTGKIPLYKEVMLWIGAVFFSACLVALVVRLLESGPPMRFSRDGFEARCYGIPFVPWTDVETAWTARIKSSDLLCIKLRNPAPVLEKLSAFRRRTARLNQKLGFGDICLAATGMKPGFSEMLEYARKYIPQIGVR